MIGTTINLHSGIRFRDRVIREIKIEEEKLTFNMMASGVIHLHDEEGKRLLSLSPSAWSHVSHPGSDEKSL